MSNTTINFYEGSYCFENISTNLNVSPDFVEMKLAKQFEYRPTDMPLWATIIKDGIEIARYWLKYGEGLFKIK